jgi:hypothetical protein
MTDAEREIFDARFAPYIAEVVIGADPPPLSDAGIAVVRRTFGATPVPGVDALLDPVPGSAEVEAPAAAAPESSAA